MIAARFKFRRPEIVKNHGIQPEIQLFAILTKLNSTFFNENTFPIVKFHQESI